MQTTPLKIGISACLLGAKVRFDGGHKISHFVTNELDRYAEFVSVCPEMGMGYLSRVPHYDLSRKMNGLRWWKPKTARAITPQR